jgi:WhiB family redox-sensing transcriptional regulator
VLVGDSVSWQERGRCRDLDPDLFFPPVEAESSEQRHAREGAAKAVCSSCPVRQECLTWALTNRERLGVWGGHTERERQLLTASRRSRTARVVAAG